MALFDNIHQGKIQFTKEQFSLMDFSFIGDISLGGKCIANNIHFEGNYGITGIIELTMYCDIEIEPTKDGKFINYKICGYDDEYTYLIDEAFFTSSYFSPNKFSKEVYYGKPCSNIIIVKKDKLEMDYVVCDCICNNFPVLTDNFSIGGRDINIIHNRNYSKNEEYIKNLLGVSIRYRFSGGEIAIDKEISFFNDFELILSFMLGYDFGISICKFINASANSIETYIIRERKSNCNSSHFIFSDDIAKMRDFVENSQIQSNINKLYYKETITALIKIINEPDMLINWAVLIIALERFLTNLLIENGFKKEELIGDGRNLVYKLNKYNGIIKKIPKKYTDNKLINDYRNPLFHSGEVFATNIDELVTFFFMYSDLLYALIFDSVGYTGDYILRSDSFKFGKLF